jgi:hypothetical protein
MSEQRLADGAREFRFVTSLGSPPGQLTDDR